MARAAFRDASSCAQVPKATSTPWRTAQCPRAWARWDLPVPQGPTIRIGARSVRERPGGRFQLRQPVEVELIERLAGAEGRASQARVELLLFAAGHLVLDQQRQEV